jgi:hypothetical protein
MSTEVKAFTCDFCPKKKRFASRGGANRHESFCFYNPIRHACATCKHFEFVPYYSEAETGYSEGGPYCEIDKFNTTEGEQPLRVECEFWESRA